MNDFFTDPIKATAEDSSVVLINQPGKDLEVTTTRRRKDSDLLIEPGDDARAIARLMGQDIRDFIVDAIDNHIATFRAKLRN